uniref:Uncharacterized protein n=1 Tax=Knipowitschia caucasica TaxID=637954 RepID=A0AAV2M101_KNICA
MADLYRLGLRPSLQYPARLRITEADGVRRTFGSVVDAESRLARCKISSRSFHRSSLAMMASRSRRRVSLRDEVEFSFRVAETQVEVAKRVSSYTALSLQRWKNEPYPLPKYVDEVEL